MHFVKTRGSRDGQALISKRKFQWTPGNVLTSTHHPESTATMTWSLTAPTEPRAVRERTPMWSAGRGWNKGFTLIELVVVLSILGLATALTVPVFSRTLD